MVINTHISNGENFFNIEPPKCDYIISNPPYSIKGDVLNRLFEYDIPFAMLVGVVGLFESQKRFDMFKKYPYQMDTKLLN
jgi:methylase of polypeptide subunit release factors